MTAIFAKQRPEPLMVSAGTCMCGLPIWTNKGEMVIEGKCPVCKIEVKIENPNGFK